MAIAGAGEGEREEFGVELELAASMESPFRRTFWVEPPQFEAVDLSQFDPDAAERREVFEDFAALRHLDWQQMRDRVSHLLSTHDMPTLSELLDRFPLTSGVVEIAGYLQIASEDGHLVDPLTSEKILIPASESDKHAYVVKIPRVTFRPFTRN